MSVQRQPLPHRDCTGCRLLLLLRTGCRLLFLLRMGCTGCRPPSQRRRGYRLFLQNTGCTGCRPLLLLHKDCMPKQFSGVAHNIRLLHRQRMPNMGCMGYKLLPCTGYRGCRPFWQSRGCTDCRLLPLLQNRDCTRPSWPLHMGCTDCRLQAWRPRMGCRPLSPLVHLRRFRLPWHRHSG